MTLVHTETGEAIEPLGRQAAERLTTRIALKLDAMADTYAGVMPMIREAITREAFRSLGYRSVGEYVQDRFGDALSKLGVDMRRVVIGELTEAGMSTRAIASVVGVSKSQVANDQQVSRTGHLTQTPADSSAGAAPAEPGHTPKVAPDEEDATPAGVQVSTDDSTAATPGGETPATPRPPVVGIDGKTYSRPEPRAPKPVLAGESAEYDNAEQAAKALARAVSKLLEFQHPNMREGMRRYWSMASIEVPPASRRDVTPEQMRAAAHGLLALASEWDD